jgi:hypothetical protein
MPGGSIERLRAQGAGSRGYGPNAIANAPTVVPVNRWVSGGVCGEGNSVTAPAHPYNASNLAGFDATRRTETRTSAHSPALPERGQRSYTIFEGTSEVQRLVIARSISGVHIR